MRSTPLIRALGIAFLLVGCRGTADPETPRSPDAAATATQSTPRSAEGEPHRFSCRQLADRYRIEIDGALFAEYVFRGHPSPIVYPVHGAHGIAVTRGHPMHTNSGEATDHPHHRSLWFAHGDINGHDFWHRGGRVEQRKAIVAQGSHGVVLTTHNDYLAGDSRTLLCDDTRVLAFHVGPRGRYLDYQVTLHASRGDLHFGDTKEGTMAIRVAPWLRLVGKSAKGAIRTSEGRKDREAWGRRARWVDYFGTTAGETVGVALFDHPQNHGFPCRWHAREYGLLAANPFGVRQFRDGRDGAGGVRLAKGKSLTLRYRFYFHKGDTTQAEVAAEYGDWVK
ncbi:MAG: PmoA family protein [Planctomycetes bacterium]|nr:PmoA family protein [Planctomycetota bacterium]